jgi:hypothetical protein
MVINLRMTGIPRRLPLGFIKPESKALRKKSGDNPLERDLFLHTVQHSSHIGSFPLGLSITFSEFDRDA